MGVAKMNLAHLFRKSAPSPETLPDFIRAVEDVGGVRILRLRGSVGKEIGYKVTERNEQLERQGENFERPLLLDFAGTAGWDFSTVSFLVDALRRRMAASARVGIVNAPNELIAELQIARLEGLFVLSDTEQDALAALKPGSFYEGGLVKRSGHG
jgi:hypothetical protein